MVREHNQRGYQLCHAGQRHHRVGPHTTKTSDPLHGHGGRALARPWQPQGTTGHPGLRRHRHRQPGRGDTATQLSGATEHKEPTDAQGHRTPATARGVRVLRHLGAGLPSPIDLGGLTAVGHRLIMPGQSDEVFTFGQMQVFLGRLRGVATGLASVDHALVWF